MSCDVTWSGSCDFRDSKSLTSTEVVVDHNDDAKHAEVINETKNGMKTRISGGSPTCNHVQQDIAFLALEIFEFVLRDIKDSLKIKCFFSPGDELGANQLFCISVQIEDHIIIMDDVHDKNHHQQQGEDTYIFCHGYSWGTVTYPFLIRDLLIQAIADKKPIHLICVDMLGFGASSRPKFDRNMTTDVAVEFMLAPLHRMIKKVMKKKIRKAKSQKLSFLSGDIILCGHSIGAYFASEYCRRHSNIAKLVLLSPCGFADIPLHLDPEHPEKEIERSEFHSKVKSEVSWWQYFSIRVATTFWDNKYSAFKIMKWFPTSYAMNRVRGYLTNRGGQYNTHEELIDLISKWYFASNKIIDSGDLIIYLCFASPQHANRPIATFIDEINVKELIVMYGDCDWMDPSLCYEFLCDKLNIPKTTTFEPLVWQPPLVPSPKHSKFKKNEKKIKDDLKVKMWLTKESGHQMPLENSQAIAELMMDSDHKKSHPKAIRLI